MKQISEISEEEIMSTFKQFYDGLSEIIEDPIYKIRITEKMINSDFEKFEYFGDKFLTMDDFWGQLTPENRLVLLGNLMNTNTMHFFYGKYKEIFLSLANIISMKDEQKKQFENQMNDLMNPKQTKQDYIS